MALPRPIPDAVVELIASRLHALSQPLRIRIVDRLDQGGETTAHNLADHLGSGQHNTSRHLNLLHHAGLLARRQEERQVWYSVSSPEVFALLEQASAHGEMGDPHSGAT